LLNIIGADYRDLAVNGYDSGFPSIFLQLLQIEG